MRSRIGYIAVATVLCLMTWASPARAENTDPFNEDNATVNGVRGAIGLGLIGAELPLIIEGALGVRNPWLLSVIPIVVAGGGAAGGYFMGQASPEAGVATLVIGLALVIPAALLVAYGYRYRSARGEEPGYVDRTEEGAAEDREWLDDADESGTQTEVIGPEDEQPSDQRPDTGDDESDGDSSSLTPSPAPLATVRLDGGLPVSGVLRLVADASSSRQTRPIRLSWF